MDSVHVVFMAVLLPIIGSLLIPLLGKFSSPVRNGASLFLALCPLALSISLLPDVIDGRVITVSHQLIMGINVVFQADRLAVFMAIASSLISAVIVLYSFGYISRYHNQGEYYFMVILFLGAMMGIIYSANLILLYVFWEITGIVSWRLIGFYRTEAYVLRADKAFLVTVFGALVMLVGFIILREQSGSFDYSAVKNALLGRAIHPAVVLLILFGILSKSATLPFHTWLPDAGVAPSPVTALLHAAVLVKIGVYVYARLFVATFDIGPSWYTAMPAIAGASAIIAACAALRDTDIKRIIAYSTISQIGFIFLGLSVASPVGIAGGLLYILMHGIAKAGLFLCAGIIEHNSHEKDITKMGGLITTMPVTAIAFLLCAFSVMGIPPFGGFFCKYMVIAGAAAGDQMIIAGIFIVGAVLTIIYLFRLFALVFMGEPTGTPAAEGSPVMVWSVVLLAFLSLAGGIAIYYPSYFTQLTIQQMLGALR